MPVETFEQRVKEAKTKQQLTAYVEQVYAATERIYEPMPPFLLVRTLPRSTITAGGIILPEKQNKPNIEAIVVAVYKPFWEKAFDANDRDVSVWNECDLKVGDHIVMPHHVGLPDNFLDEREYRFIREDDAICRIDYYDKGEVRKMVRKVMVEALTDAEPGEKITDSVCRALFEQFDVMPKVIYSRTTSGK